MANDLVPPDEPRDVGAQDPLHARNQIGLGCLDHQVEVISKHTAIA